MPSDRLKSHKVVFPVAELYCNVFTVMTLIEFPSVQNLLTWPFKYCNAISRPIACLVVLFADGSQNSTILKNVQSNDAVYMLLCKHRWNRYANRYWTAVGLGRTINRVSWFKWIKIDEYYLNGSRFGVIFSTKLRYDKHSYALAIL